MGFTLYSNRDDKCPICGGKHERCRIDEGTGVIICGTLDLSSKWTYLGQDKAGIGYMYTLTSEQSNYVPFKNRIASPTKKALTTSFSPQKLNDLFYELLGPLPVPNWALDDLTKRGIKPVGLLGKSLPFGFIDKKYEGLPGVFNHDLGFRIYPNIKDGYFCPVYNHQGLVVGGQIKTRNFSHGKYLWVSAASKDGVNHHIDGKTPHTFCSQNKNILCNFYYKSKLKKRLVILSEGILKPNIINEKTGYIAIGASGGNFTSNTDALVLAINEAEKQLGGKATYALAADAGSGDNDLVMRKYESLHDFLQKKFNTGLKVIYYNQLNKGIDKDFDDFDFNKNNHFELIDFYQYKNIILARKRLKELSHYSAEKTFQSRYLEPEAVIWGEDLLNPFDEFVRHIQHGERQMLCLKSPMGTGKTALLESLVKTLRFVILGYRNSLLSQTASRVKGLTLLSSLGVLGDKLPLVSLGFCVDSLLKFRSDDAEGAIIVIDEAPHVIQHLLTSDTCKRYRVDIEARLKNVLSKASGIVIMSDQMSDREVEYISNLSSIRSASNLIRVENTYRMNPRVINSHENKLSWCQLLVNTIKEKKRTLTLCDSKAETERLALKTQTLDPSAKVLCINSATLYKREVSSFLADPNKALRLCQYDHVFCSPTAESGLSIDLEGYFDHIFLCWTHLGVKSAVQMMHRCRDTNVPIDLFAYTRRDSNKKIYEYVTEKIENAQTAWNRYNSVYIDDLDEEENKEISSNIQKKAYFAFDPTNPRWKYFKGTLEIELLERQNFRAFFLDDLKQRGYTINSVNLTDINKEEVSTVKESETLKTERAEMILNAPVLSYDESEILSKQEVKTPLEMATIVRSLLEHSLPNIDLTDIWGLELVKEITQNNRNAISQIWMRECCSYPYLIEWNLIKTKMSLNERNLYPTDVTQKHLLADSLHKLFNIEEISNQKLHDNHPLVLNVIQKARRDRLLPKQKKTSNIKYFNVLLNYLGYQLKGHQQRVNGDRIRFYSLTDIISYKKKMGENLEEEVLIYPFLSKPLEQYRLNQEVIFTGKSHISRYRKHRPSRVNQPQPPPQKEKRDSNITFISGTLNLDCNKKENSKPKSNPCYYHPSQLSPGMYIDFIPKKGVQVEKAKIEEVYHSYVIVSIEIDTDGNQIIPTRFLLPGEGEKPLTEEKQRIVYFKNIFKLWTKIGPGQFSEHKLRKV